MTLQRAKELRILSGSAGCYPQPDIKPATPEERAEINARWKRMPGWTCFYDAIRTIECELEQQTT